VNAYRKAERLIPIHLSLIPEPAGTGYYLLLATRHFR
jgi:hypothetical protein